MRTLATLLAVLVAALASTQHEIPERTLKVEEYGRWESLSQARISRDGRWVAYRVNVDENHAPSESFLREYPGWGPRLVVRTAGAAVGSSGSEWIVPHGQVVTFSDDSKWAAYLISLPRKDAERLREQKQPVETKLGIRNLENGEVAVHESIQNFAFLPDAGGKATFLLAHRFRGQTKPSGGSDLLILNLETGESTTLGNVASFAVRPEPREPTTKEWGAVALLIDSDSGHRGVQLFWPGTSRVQTLHWGKDNLSGLTWDREGSRLAFFAGTKDEKKEGDWNLIRLATLDPSGKASLSTIDPAKVAGLPPGKRVVEFQPVSFVSGSSQLVFGIQDWTDRKKPAGKPEDQPGLDVWHWKDLTIQPQQKLQAEADRRRSQIVLWSADGAIRLIGDAGSRGVSVLEGGKYAILWEELLYKSSTTNGIDYRDIYAIDLATGEKNLLVRRTPWNALPSPGGRFAAYFREGNWWICDLATMKYTNVTVGQKVAFHNEENDQTIPEKPAWFGTTWLADDAGLVLCDRFDAWLALPSGKLTRLTNGRPTAKRFRLVTANPNADGRVDAKGPLYFSVLDTVKKDSGYASVSNPLGASPKVDTFMYGSYGYGGLQKARDADTFILTRQSFKDSQNAFTFEPGESGVLRQMSSLNPHQREYAWGRTDLVRFKTKSGQDLQGTLIYPANFKAGTKYPMVVYIYERLSDGFHNYIAPAEASAYNLQHFSQQGYFVLLPDIAYRPRNPGMSAIEALEPALDAAMAKAPAIDPKKVGLVGHSWGGYQTAFVLSKSKRFAAGVAGAPLTELISMYLSVYWNSGTPDQELLETGQGRMEVPFWNDLKSYLENSPVFNAGHYTSPILIAFGDKDGAVDWHQGLYLYNTLRRMGKEIIFLLYEGENHGLARRPNQLDYARRVRHFFDVHLKGASAEPWIKEGVPFLKKGEG